ncbi:MAG: class I SAM-dependent methyltransferase [Syntrophomonas sp.]
MNVIATNSQSASSITADFQEFLRESGIEFVPRQRKSLEALAAEHSARGVIVWLIEGPVLNIINEEKFFFHPSMAKNRIASFRKFGTVDPLIKACDLKENDSFLDCTLGLGADSIVASYFSRGGRVVGLESSFIIAWVVKWGMKLYCSQMDWLNTAIKGIEVVAADHSSYLKELDDNSFDIVYFDPMFRQPLLKSQAIAPLRLMADHRELRKESIIEACRVARKKVVVKEMVSSPEFERLGLRLAPHSPHNKIAFGVIETGKG